MAIEKNEQEAEKKWINSEINKLKNLYIRLEI